MFVTVDDNALLWDTDWKFNPIISYMRMIYEGIIVERKFFVTKNHIYIFQKKIIMHHNIHSVEVLCCIVYLLFYLLNSSYIL